MLECEARRKSKGVVNLSVLSRYLIRSLVDPRRLDFEMGFGIYFLPLLRRFSSSNLASIRNLTLRSPFVRCFGMNRG
jgi:hypothetical protein